MRGHGEKQSDHHHRHSDEKRVGSKADELGVEEKDAEVLERGRLVEHERIVGGVDQIAGLLEARDQHPGEREGREGGESGDHREGDRLGARGSYQR